MNTEDYFKELEEKVQVCYSVAEEARKKGLDPLDKVEIKMVRNLAERVIGLISVKYPQLGEKIVQRISELEKEYGLLDFAVAFKIAEEIAKEKFCKFKDLLEAIDAGLRVAFGYLTVGVVAAPLEGYTHFKLKKTREGKDYFCLYFSGPIGAAGRTIASTFLLIADYLRQVFGFAEYDPTEEEIKRAVMEVYDRHERVTNLQYLPSREEIEFMYSRMPIQIDGDPTENKEVSNYKDLERIETNFIRSGFCLILGEGISQKASKLIKVLGKMEKKGIDLSRWNFLKDFVELQKSIQQKKKEEESSAVYIKDLVAGRPVLGHPGREGGFRLRYGKSRMSGLSSMAMHPFTMEFLKNYIGVGTQLKYEGPGKSSAMSLCDEMEPPIIKIKNGSVIKIDSKDKAKKYKEELEEVLFLGDFLVNYGEYFNRGKHLQKPGYVEEWFSAELEKKLEEKKIKDEDFLNFLKKIAKNWRTQISIKDALRISDEFDMPLYPKYTFYWSMISKEQLLDILYYIKNASFSEGKIILPYSDSAKEKFSKAKRALELIGAEHIVGIENLILDELNSSILMVNFGIYNFSEKTSEKIREEIDESIKKAELSLGKNAVEILNNISRYKIKDRTGTFIGARMGRPEKAKLRKLIGSPCILFPVGAEGGRFRSVNEAEKIGEVKAEFPVYFCTKCNKETIYYICEECGNKTNTFHYCKECHQRFENKICPEHKIGQRYYSRKIDIKHYLAKAAEILGMEKSEIPVLIKGVKGTSNENHIPENLAKGILRAKNNLSVNKDGTTRYDMTEMPITHFKPKEVGTSIEKLRELGYKEDIYGKELENEDQLLEIFSQDVILPACPESDDEKADDVFIKISKFLDELLVKFYKIEPFYNIKKREELIGHLIVGLAPHTSAGMLGRIIGFTKTQGCFSHPMWHAAQRRDCEGDETCAILLLDALLNFSRDYLPAHRGASQDAPFVITSRLIPAEIDDMAFDMDVVWKYPLELYEAAENEKYPWDIKIEQLSNRLGKEEAYHDFGFTHNLNDFNDAVRFSAYKSLPTMAEKVNGQMWIAEKLRSVDADDVARLVIDRHFMRDLRGNLRKFFEQEFRCVSCNEKYRRPPLTGKCEKCGGKIIFTVAYGSIIKYLEQAEYLANKYNVPEYIKENLHLTKLYIESVFGKETEKQSSLASFE